MLVVAMTIRVFLLDDHEIVRTGLRSLLSVEDDLEVVGEAGTSEDALARIPVVRPDVALLDVRLPDGNGVEVCREIRSHHPSVGCLILTSFADDEALFAAIMAGAAGYVIKQASGTHLVDDIRRVAAGRPVLERDLVEQVMARVRANAARDRRLELLTEQERRILEQIAEGRTNRQIGDSLYLAEKTVKNYVSALLAKLGMQGRTEAAGYAARVRERQARGIAPDSTGT